MLDGVCVNRCMDEFNRTPGCRKSAPPGTGNILQYCRDQCVGDPDDVHLDELNPVVQFVEEWRPHNYVSSSSLDWASFWTRACRPDRGEGRNTARLWKIDPKSPASGITEAPKAESTSNWTFAKIAAGAVVVGGALAAVAHAAYKPIASIQKHTGEMIAAGGAVLSSARVIAMSGYRVAAAAASAVAHNPEVVAKAVEAGVDAAIARTPVGRAAMFVFAIGGFNVYSTNSGPVVYN